MNDTMSKQPSITIKKYANRRLYNTATSTYVTLEDLSSMVKECIDFNVYDAKTSEDITRSVLTQIIVEEESKSGQQNLLPISFLRQLIGFYGDSLQWMVPKYLEQSMQALTGNQDQIRSYFQNTFGNLFPFGTTLEEMSKQNLAMFERTMRMFTPFNVENMTAEQNSTDTSCCATSEKAAASCCTMTQKPAQQNTSNNQTEQTSASVTNLKPRNEPAKASESQPQEKASAPAVQPNNTPSSTQQTNTPMPNVQANTSAAGSDDMQQKIANLQRQLADLAKSRA